MSRRSCRWGGGIAAAGLVAAALLWTAPAQAQSELRYLQLPESERSGQFQGQRGLAVQLMAGPMYQRLYSLDVAAGDLEINIGSQQRWGGLFGGINASFGRSPGGLFINGLRANVFYEGQVGPVRLGAGLYAGTLGYVRATNANYSMSLGAGLRGHAAVDMATWETGALFLNVRVGAEFLAVVTPSPMVAGHLGVRFF